MQPQGKRVKTSGWLTARRELTPEEVAANAQWEAEQAQRRAEAARLRSVLTDLRERHAHLTAWTLAIMQPAEGTLQWQRQQALHWGGPPISDNGEDVLVEGQFEEDWVDDRTESVEAQIARAEYDLRRLWKQY